MSKTKNELSVILDIILEESKYRANMAVALGFYKKLHPKRFNTIAAFFSATQQTRIYPWESKTD